MCLNNIEKHKMVDILKKCTGEEEEIYFKNKQVLIKFTIKLKGER